MLAIALTRLWAVLAWLLCLPCSYMDSNAGGQRFCYYTSGNGSGASLLRLDLASKQVVSPCPSNGNVAGLPDRSNMPFFCVILGWRCRLLTRPCFFSHAPCLRCAARAVERLSQQPALVRAGRGRQRGVRGRLGRRDQQVSAALCLHAGCVSCSIARRSVLCVFLVRASVFLWPHPACSSSSCFHAVSHHRAQAYDYAASFLSTATQEHTQLSAMCTSERNAQGDPEHTVYAFWRNGGNGVVERINSGACVCRAGWLCV